MNKAPDKTLSKTDLATLSAAQLRAMVAGYQAQVAEREKQLAEQEKRLAERQAAIHQRDCYIQILEERLRLKKIQQFAARSEKSPDQWGLFDEAELEAEIEALSDQLPDEAEDKEQGQAPRKRRQRRRGFSDQLKRERVELRLSEAEKDGASQVFFTKVKEELHFIPAQLKVIEYWQEKAVFDHGDEQQCIVAAPRPVHPLGKCCATPALIAYIIAAKYADGLPLYRLEQRFKRLGQTVSRTSMAHWIIGLEPMLRRLVERLRTLQNRGDYLQADETRIQVLKQDGKKAQSDKWMWVTRGGPPGQVSVLFDYDPSRAGSVAVRLLDGFKGILQVDGYAAYATVCRDNGITRIGCWDHARRKFVEAVRAAPTSHKSRGKPGKANTALSYIAKLYRIEQQVKDLSDAERYRVRQTQSVAVLEQFKAWLEANASRVLKGSLTRKAIDYTLSQWSFLIGYCERGDLRISNVLAENAIRPFAVGRRAWLFADTARGARASACCYSLIETAKANGVEPAAYIQHVIEHIAEADTSHKLDRLLPWNVNLANASGNTTPTD